MPRLSIVLLAVVAASSTSGPLLAQQPAVAATGQAVQPVAPQPPFQVEPAHQVWLDQVLAKWEKDSATVQTFYCDFERDQHVAMLGPANGQPFIKEKGKLGYTKPDQGSFQITEATVWTVKQQAAPAPNADPAEPQADQKVEGTYEASTEPGEHWVCNGKNVYQYRSHDKQLVVTPIPGDLQGQQIVDGPLPFLFGADATKLKERFWLRPDPALCGQKYLGIHAKPKRQEDAANYSDVWVVLRNEPGKPLMPAGLRVLHPNKTWDEYRFNLKAAQVNPVFAGWFAKLFQEPRTPWGWQRVVEPMRQAQGAPPQQR